MHQILLAFKMAFYNLKANFLHTLLSVLGIVIGVAALVTILSLIDGMESYARHEIESTSSLNSLAIRAKTGERKDGVFFEYDSIPTLMLADLAVMEQQLSYEVQASLMHVETGKIALGDTAELGIYAYGVKPFLLKRTEILAGRPFSKEEYQQKKAVAVINQTLAEKAFPGQTFKDILGKFIVFHQQEYRIVGIGDTGKEVASFARPLSLLTDAQIAEDRPVAYLEAAEVEDLLKIKEEVKQWLKKRYGKEDAFILASNEMRLQQLEKAMLVFRIVMGLITGISVLVGGIGIMNVLLIAVTERTREIGIRKATGARPRDIVWQFLSESITISSFGSFLGLLLGVIAALGVMPVINHFAGASFQAAFTLQTLFIISGVAIFVGIVFGTYPALRASRLDPVEAIRHE